MPAHSEKQARLFRIVRAIQKGADPTKFSKQARKMARTIKPSSVKHFTKLKEILNFLKENEFSLTKFKKIDGKSLNQILQENNGIPFDQKELQVFQTKQNGFGGFGKAKFAHNKLKNELTTEIFSDNSSKKFVFKKLVDSEDKTICKYAAFIQKTFPDKPDKKIFYTISGGFDDKEMSEKTKMLSDFIDRINSYGI